MKIYIASDHRGAEISKSLIEKLNAEGINLPHTETDDYPDFAFALCKKVLEAKNNIGILLCGTGIGMSIAANKVNGIRAARCVNEEEAKLSREHNAANVLCLSTSIPQEMLIEIIKTFIITPCASDERHLRRVNKIINYEGATYNEL